MTGRDLLVLRAHGPRLGWIDECTGQMVYEAQPLIQAQDDLLGILAVHLSVTKEAVAQTETCSCSMRWMESPAMWAAELVLIACLWYRVHSVHQSGAA